MLSQSVSLCLYVCVLVVNFVFCVTTQSQRSWKQREFCQRFNCPFMVISSLKYEQQQLQHEILTVWWPTKLLFRLSGTRHVSVWLRVPTLQLFFYPFLFFFLLLYLGPISQRFHFAFMFHTASDESCQSVMQQSKQSWWQESCFKERIIDFQN